MQRMPLTSFSPSPLLNTLSQRLQRLFGGAAGMGGAQPGLDTPTVDTAEMVYISSLALLKVRVSSFEPSPYSRSS